MKTNLLWTTSAEFIREQPITALPYFCKQAREYILKVLNITGGHLASNLATIETIMAMHYVFDYRKHIFLFDTGHQAYLHKMLVKRDKSLLSLGSTKGWSTFVTRHESQYDIYSPGHAGTSLSTSIAYLWLQKNNAAPKKKYVLIHVGDAAFTNGILLQALNDSFLQNSSLIIVLNDNKMAIGPNTGFIASELSFIDKERYLPTRQKLKTKKFEKFLAFFNIEYISVNDGHSVANIISALKEAINFKAPVLIHVHTVKGYKYQNTTTKSTPYFHKVKAHYDCPKLHPLSKIATWTFTDQIGKLLFLFFRANQNIFLIFASSSFSNNFNFLRDYDPSRFHDVGIAEEHALLICAALAHRGKIPIYYIYSTFLQRCYDQLVHDIYNPKAKIILLIDRAEISDFEGISHHGIYDIAILSTISQFNIIAPTDCENMKMALSYAINDTKIATAIRFSKKNCPQHSGTVSLKNINGPIWIDYYQNYSKAHVFIITYGEHVNLFDQQIQKQQVQNICLINSLFLRPIDEKMLGLIITARKKVIIYEHTHAQNGLMKIINSTITHNPKLLATALKYNWFSNYQHLHIIENYVYHGKSADFLTINKLNYAKIILDIKQSKKNNC